MCEAPDPTRDEVTDFSGEVVQAESVSSEVEETLISAVAVVVVPSNERDDNAEDALGIHGPAITPQEQPNTRIKALSDLSGAMLVVESKLEVEKGRQMKRLTKFI